MATALQDMSNGKFVRKDAQFRDFVEKGGRFEPEPKRYSLYVSLACPWATRTLAFRALKGLENVIGNLYHSSQRICRLAAKYEILTKETLQRGLAIKPRNHKTPFGN